MSDPIQEWSNFLVNGCRLSYACSMGYLWLSEQLARTREHTPFEVDMSMKLAARGGHLHIIQILMSVFEIDSLDIVFLEASHKGHLHILEYISKITNNFPEDVLLVSFKAACYYGHKNVVEWMLKHYAIDIHDNEDEIFCTSCFRGHLCISQLLLKQGEVNMLSHDQIAFWGACIHGHISTVDWLYKLTKDKLDITKSKINHAIKLCKEKNHPHIIPYLRKLI